MLVWLAVHDYGGATSAWARQSCTAARAAKASKKDARQRVHICTSLRYVWSEA